MAAGTAARIQFVGGVQVVRPLSSTALSPSQEQGSRLPLAPARHAPVTSIPIFSPPSASTFSQGSRWQTLKQKARLVVRV